jgi:hypothetical protein
MREAQAFELPYVSVWDKCIALPLLLGTFAFEIFLVWASTTDWTAGTGLSGFIAGSRTETQIIVLLLSTALAATQLWIAAYLVNSASRLSLTRSFTSVERLKALRAMSIPSIDWSLRFESLCLVICYFLLGLGPSVLWTGALTPLAASKSEEGLIVIPKYFPDPQICIGIGHGGLILFSEIST